MDQNEKDFEQELATLVAPTTKPREAMGLAWPWPKLS